MKRKKVILAAINAKYIHSNLAVYTLRANAGVYADCIQVCEYTINHQKEEILAGLYEEKPDIVGFSCYLWNIAYVISVARDLKKILPGVKIVAGGPEVSYRPESFLMENDCFDLIMVGEGERTFAEYLACELDGRGELSDIDGLVYREGAQILRTAPRQGLCMDDLVFPYDSLEGLENHILYYESIRGCPFSCSYCLSSIEKTVRIKSLEKTCRELDFFIRAKVPQVKFVDRTFNCNHEHAYGVWKYLHEHDNGVTNFHFEIAGDLLREEDFELLHKLRPGLVQFEVGVQSTNPDTIRAIRRIMDLNVLEKNMKLLHEGRNIHAHLDLIAGLPYENYDSFHKSFNDVYAMKPDQFQLGFLKVLSGSYMDEKKNDYGVLYEAEPPYEVFSTNWLPYEDVRRLKQVEEMVEVYYNSFQFAATMTLLEHYFEDAFTMYQELGKYYKKMGLFACKHNRIARYEILWDFIGTLKQTEKISTDREPARYKLTEFESTDRELFRQTLTYDLYSRDYVKKPPAFVREHGDRQKAQIRRFFDRTREKGTLPAGYEGYVVKQLYNLLYIDTFTLDIPELLASGEVRETEAYSVMFDYRERSPLDHSARVRRIDEVIDCW